MFVTTWDIFNWWSHPFQTLNSLYSADTPLSPLIRLTTAPNLLYLLPNANAFSATYRGDHRYGSHNFHYLRKL